MLAKLTSFEFNTLLLQKNPFTFIHFCQYIFSCAEWLVVNRWSMDYGLNLPRDCSRKLPTFGVKLNLLMLLHIVPVSPSSFIWLKNMLEKSEPHFPNRYHGGNQTDVASPWQCYGLQKSHRKSLSALSSHSIWPLLPVPKGKDSVRKFKLYVKSICKSLHAKGTWVAVVTPDGKSTKWKRSLICGKLLEKCY